MNRISTKISQKISVFLQDNDIYTGTGQQKRGHHSGWAATGNTATNAYAFQGRAY